MFFLLYGKGFRRFRVIITPRERSRLVPLKAMPTGRPTPLANAAIEISPVITVAVIRLVSMMPMIVLNILSQSLHSDFLF